LVETTTLRQKNSIQITKDVPAHKIFEFVQKYGQGGFGEVWGCNHKETGEQYAIKRIALREAENKAGSTERMHRELQVFVRLENPYIVKLHEVLMDSTYLYLVMDICSGGDLAAYLYLYVDDPDRIMRKLEFPDHVMGLPTKIVGQLLWQMLAGLAYMHHHYFCHRDIKLQNYMIKAPHARPQLQLVDFGMAVRFKKGGMITGTAGTIKYMAPEVLSGSYNEKCDIWASGIVCFILCTERSPWGGSKNGGELAQCITEGWREPWPSCDKPNCLRSLIDTMLDRDMQARPSAKRLLKTSGWIQKCSREGGGGGDSCCTLS